MSWRSIKRLNRKTGRTFVTASAHHNGDVYAVSQAGETFIVARKGREPEEVYRSQTETTTADYLASGERRSWVSDDWYDEIDRRLRELTGA